MSVLDRHFVVAEIMQVPAGASLRGFPQFPRAGWLVILAPPHVPVDQELNGLSARVAVGGKAVTLRYAYWQLNEASAIGLLCEKVDEAAMPLGSPVTFVKRAQS